MLSNMQKDQELFNLAKPCVRVYTWEKPTITYGYCQKVDLDQYRREGWGVEQRPTGGGIVFHEKGNLSFTIIMPRNGLKVDEAVALTANKLADFLKTSGLEVKIESKQKSSRANLCVDYISRNEISLNGKKIIGIAQRFGKKVVLQQGTIFGSYPQITINGLEKALIT